MNKNLSEVENLNNQIADLHGENKNLSSKIDEYKDTLNKLKLNEIQMKEQISSSQNQINMLNRQLTGEKTTLEETEEHVKRAWSKPHCVCDTGRGSIHRYRQSQRKCPVRKG